MAKVRAFLDALRDVRALRSRVDDLERELIRLSPQLAAVEQRLETLRATVEDPAWTGDDADRAEARRLIDEVRAEHARVRARISAATVFEERLRVVEEKLRDDPAP